MKTVSHSAAEIAGELSKAWRAIQENHPDLPDAFVRICAGDSRPGRLLNGFWSSSRWKTKDGETVGEIAVSGERLGDGGRPVFETILHEAAHGVGAAREIKNTSRGGRYHNVRFRKLAEELGLEVQKCDVYGWRLTELRPETAEAYSEVIQRLEAAIGASRQRRAQNKKAREKPRKSRIKLECSCSPPRAIMVAPGVAELGPIHCGLCEEEFLAVG